MLDHDSWTIEQTSVIRSNATSTCVIAAPGSGKTAVLTEHIVYTVRHDRIPPQHVMAMTFTRQAAEHMRGRLAQHSSLSLRESEALKIGTFHAQMFHVLLETNADIPVILNGREQHEYMRQALSQTRTDVIDYHLVTQWLTTYSRDVGTGAMSSLSRKKRKVYTAYRRLKRRNGRWDYEDILLEMEALLEVGSVDLPFAKLAYVLVDEFQDTNAPQWSILRSLQDRYGLRVFVVGDDDQSIYSFRGASPEYLRQARSYLMGATQHLLTHNFRSRATIVDHAEKLILCSPSRIDKPLRAASQLPGYIRALRVEDTEVEHLVIVEYLEFLQSELPTLSTIAVLGRTRRQIAPVWLAARRAAGSQWPAWQSKIQFRTFHDSKGKEWDVVFLLDLVDSVESNHDIDEERRLFYVAMTRAKFVLLGFIPNRSGRHRRLPSRFVSEAELEVVDASATKFSELRSWVEANV